MQVALAVGYLPACWNISRSVSDIDQLMVKRRHLGPALVGKNPGMPPCSSFILLSQERQGDTQAILRSCLALWARLFTHTRERVYSLGPPCSAGCKQQHTSNPLLALWGPSHFFGTTCCSSANKRENLQSWLRSTASPARRCCALELHAHVPILCARIQCVLP